MKHACRPGLRPRLGAGPEGPAYVGLALIVSLAAQQPVFRAAIDYVRVDVVVTDSSDRPVRDLKKTDFEIVERGRPQAINDFQFVDIPVTTRTTEALPPPGPPPDVAVNTPPSPKSRLFVVIVDDLHILESNIVGVKKVLTDFIRALSPDDEAALVFVSHSNLSQNFTSDRGLLLKAVDRVNAALGFGLDAMGRSSNTEFNTSKIMLAYARTADSVMKNVVLALAGSSHPRRAIVYVSDGPAVKTDPPSPNDRLPSDWEFATDVFETARKWDVPIYTLDPRGQVLPEDAVRGGISAIGSVDAQGQTFGGQIPRSLIAENIRQQANRLSEFALNTGGRAFTGQSDLTKAVNEIVAENGSFYLLGYYPTPFQADGKYHEFSVKVNRPGVRVRARNGYLASSAASSTGDAKPLLDSAMSTGVNVSGLPVRGFAAPIAAGAKGVNTIVTIDVEYPAPVDGTRHIDDNLQVSVLALDPDGKIKASSSRALRFAGTAPGQGPVNFSIDEVIDLPAQPLTLRVGVASQALAKAGTVQFGVEVPKPGDGKLQLGGLVIGFDGPPRTAVMRSEVLKSLVPFQPATTRSFSTADTLRVLVPVLWAGKDASAQVAVSIRRSTIVAVERRGQADAPAGSGTNKQASFIASLPLAGLSPGRYTLHAEATQPNGRTAARDVVIEVR